MKILLISANTERIPYYIYPLGLDYVAGSISDRHDVTIADVNETGGIMELGKVIQKTSPDLIGISLRNIDNTEPVGSKKFIGIYEEIVTVVRKNSGAAIVLGGSGFTIFPGTIMKALGADYGIIGEGERFPLLLDALEQGKDPANIPGVITRDSDEMVPPPWDRPWSRKIDPALPHVAFYIQRGGMLNLQTKRGCNYRCIYCTYPHIEGASLRLIDPEEVADTAMALQKAGAKYFFITDSVFNNTYDHSRRVARAFKKKGITIPWGAFCAPTRPPEGYYRDMADAGMTHIEFGTESLSDAMLTSYQKPFTVDDALSAHQEAVDAGIYVAHYLLLGGPGENRVTVNETLDNAALLKKSVIFFFYGMRIYPNTPLYDIAIRECQITESENLLEPVFYQSKDICSEEILRSIEERAGNRDNWIIGAGGKFTARIVSRMHKQGHTGPLWEYLIR